MGHNDGALEDRPPCPPTTALLEELDRAQSVLLRQRAINMMSLRLVPGHTGRPLQQLVEDVDRAFLACGQPIAPIMSFDTPLVTANRKRRRDAASLYTRADVEVYGVYANATMTRMHGERLLQASRVMAGEDAFTSKNMRGALDQRVRKDFLPGDILQASFRDGEGVRGYVACVFQFHFAAKHLRIYDFSDIFQWLLLRVQFPGLLCVTHLWMTRSSRGWTGHCPATILWHSLYRPV